MAGALQWRRLALSANYLGWRWALDGGRIATPEGMLRAALGAFNTKR